MDILWPVANLGGLSSAHHTLVSSNPPETEPPDLQELVDLVKSLS
jgi:hypothetical protein